MTSHLQLEQPKASFPFLTGVWGSEVRVINPVSHWASSHLLQSSLPDRWSEVTPLDAGWSCLGSSSTSVASEEAAVFLGHRDDSTAILSTLPCPRDPVFDSRVPQKVG